MQHASPVLYRGYTVFIPMHFNTGHVSHLKKHEPLLRTAEYPARNMLYWENGP